MCYIHHSRAVIPASGLCLPLMPRPPYYPYACPALFPLALPHAMSAVGLGGTHYTHPVVPQLTKLTCSRNITHIQLTTQPHSGPHCGGASGLLACMVVMPCASPPMAPIATLADRPGVGACGCMERDIARPRVPCRTRPRDLFRGSRRGAGGGEELGFWEFRLMTPTRCSGAACAGTRSPPAE